jgi:hypothetical protein
MSPLAKNLTAAMAGVAYAVVYGFWTADATGGGHVNFIWFWMFFTVNMFGLYFPIMAVLAVNLSRRTTRFAFAALLFVNFFTSAVMLYGWVNELPTDRASDFTRALAVNGWDGLGFCAFLHFLPTIVLSGLLFAVTRIRPFTDEENSESIFLK